MNTHRTLDGPGGAPREMRASEPQIRTGKYTVADSTTDGDTTTIHDGIERGSGAAGGRHCKLLPKHEKFCADVGVAEMIRRHSIRSLKRRACCL